MTLPATMARFVFPSLALIGLCSTVLVWHESSPTTGRSTEVASNDHPSESSDDEFLINLLMSSKGDFAIPAGEYELSRPLVIDLREHGAVAVRAEGPVRLVMQGAGPALRIVGSHAGSADPDQFKSETWQERMPLVDGLEIIGEHDEADGIELSGTMQATITRTTVRGARHAIRLVKRNRNVVISNVHLYHNRGIGLFLDDVNLHQINVSNSHISYNWQGGIVVRGGNVRNLHVTGCDIEANMPNDTTPTETANILIDSRPDACSIAEVAITGCTIQHYAHYHPERQAPGGANIRVLGREDYRPNMIAITGNVLSDTSQHVHLSHVTDVTLVGNTFFTTEPIDLLIEASERVTVGNCVFNPRESEGTGQIVLRSSKHCILNGLTLHRMRNDNAAVLLDRCQECQIADCIVSQARHAVELNDSSGCVIVDCTWSELDAPRQPILGNTEDNFIGSMQQAH